MSSSYPASISFEDAIGTLSFSASFPLSGDLGLHPLETFASRRTHKKESHEFLRTSLIMAVYIFLEKLTIDNCENKSSNSLF